MDHAVTTGDVLIVAGYLVGVLVILGIGGLILAFIGSGWNH